MSSASRDELTHTGARAAGDRLAQARRDIEAARFDEAQAALEALLDGGELEPSQALDSRYMLAVARRYDKDYEGSLQAVDELLRRWHDYARGWQEKGYALLALNRLEDAALAFGRAVELNPGLLASWKTLANLHARAGREEQARFAGVQAEYLVSLPKELLAVIDLTHEGRLHKAEALCRRFLRGNRQHVEGMRLLADVAVRLRIYDDAEFLLESCVEFEPGNVRARSDYLRILNRKGKFEEAYRQATILTATQPANPAFRVALANALTGIGRIEEGIRGYEACLEDGPNKPGIYVLLGHARKAAGALDEAVAAYRKAYGLEPAYGDAFWSLANTKTYRFTDDEIAHMKRYAGDATVDRDARIHFCFAAGKAFEDRREYATAFEYFDRGNALKRETTGYDPDRTRRLVEAQIETCSRELFEQRGGAGFDSPDPIFIVGLPRAGSTLLEQILASHSMVDGTMELHDILGLAQRLGGRAAAQTVGEEPRYPKILEELEPGYFRRFGEQYIDNTRVYRGRAPFFIDKMPNNFMHIGLIRLILPRAKVIDARRHPMSCCVSGFKQLFGEGQDFSYGLDSIGCYYRDYVELMDHWDAVLPDFVLRVQHEEVLDDLEGQVRRMLDFCGLPFEEACLEFHRTARSIRTPSSEQVRQPIYRSGLGQWRNYAEWLAPLKEALGPEVRRRYSIG